MQYKAGLWLVLFTLFFSCSRPVARFSYSGQPVAPATIRFDNQSENAELYQWDFGDGSRSEEVSPVHEYPSSGNYLVRLVASKGNKNKVKEERIVINAPEKCLVEIETAYGNMLIELSNATPKHRDNFVRLAEEGFYDSLLFHRVIDGFMIQGGDPESKHARAGQALGSGDPGYTLPAEFVDSLVHTKGALAAARRGDPVNPQKHSSGSQFYIVQGTAVTAEQLDLIEARKGFRYSKEQREAYLELGGTPLLDRDYTVFGRVIRGLEVIDKIAKTATDPRNRPQTDIPMKIRPVQ